MDAEDFIIADMPENGSDANLLDSLLQRNSRVAMHLVKSFVYLYLPFQDLPSGRPPLVLAFPDFRSTLMSSKVLRMPECGLTTRDLDTAIDDVLSYHKWYIEGDTGPRHWAQAYNGARFFCDVDARNDIIGQMVTEIVNSHYISSELLDRCLELYHMTLHDFHAVRRCLPFAVIACLDSQALRFDRVTACAGSWDPMGMRPGPCPQGPPMYLPGLMRQLHLPGSQSIAANYRHWAMANSISAQDEHKILYHMFPSGNLCLFHDHSNVTCNVGARRLLPNPLAQGEGVMQGFGENPGQHWARGSNQDLAHHQLGLIDSLKKADLLRFRVNDT